MTSRDVVNIVQRRLRKSKTKVGHAGTLDPLAEGVLVLGVGSAVRLVSYVQQQPKHYLATFRLGASTISGDLEGDLTLHPELPVPSRSQLEDAAAGLVGQIQQVPPAHSAIWVDGQRAHRRIRAGEVFEMPTRQVQIDSLKILRYEYPEVDLDIVCGSGTYIRTLGIDLAMAAGSNAVMTHLRRVGIGDFQYEDAISVARLREDDLESLLLPPDRAVTQLPKLTVSLDQSTRLGHGLCIEGVPTPSDDPMGQVQEVEEVAAILPGGELRAIVRRKNDMWCPHRVFPPPESKAGSTAAGTHTT